MDPLKAPRARFTPWQVTGFILACSLLLLALPFGANAAGQLVTLVDSKTSNQARVTNGQLVTSSIPAGATRWWNRVTVDAQNTSAVIFDAPAGKNHLHISSITITNNLLQNYVEAIVQFEPSCSPPDPGKVTIFDHVIAAQQTQHFDFPEPLPIDRTDSNWCLRVAALTDLEVVMVGYYY